MRPKGHKGTGYKPPSRDFHSRPSPQEKVEQRKVRAEQVVAEKNAMMQLVMDMKKEIDSLKQRDAAAHIPNREQQQGKKTRRDRSASPTVRVEPPKAALAAAANVSEEESKEDFNVRLIEQDEYEEIGEYDEETFATASTSARQALEVDHDHLRGRSMGSVGSRVRAMSELDKQRRERR